MNDHDQMKNKHEAQYNEINEKLKKSKLHINVITEEYNAYKAAAQLKEEQGRNQLNKIVEEHRNDIHKINTENDNTSIEMRRIDKEKELKLERMNIHLSNAKENNSK